MGILEIRDMNTADDSESEIERQTATQRRRLIGAGGAVTVLASLKSASALAEGVCASPSAFSSIRANPASSHRPSQAVEVCHSHGYWKNRDWPISRDTTVNGAGFLPDTVSSLGVIGTTKLFDIINASGGGVDRAFATDLISAYLDARAGAPLPVSDILAMWSVVFGAGYFAPSGGSPWTPSDVRNYLDVLIGKVAL